MALKKTELYRGFNIFTEEVRAGVWITACVEIPSGETAAHSRPPQQGRIPGEHSSKESALAAARAHIDRIHQNRKNRLR
jgi:hypothetical protein